MAETLKALDLAEFGASPELDLSEFQSPAPKPAGTIRKLSDLALSAGKSVIAVPELAVGLADLATGGRAGKVIENAGVRFKDAKNVLTGFQSDDLKGKQQQFQQADGILDKTGVALSNPSLIANTVAESVAPMLAGGVVGRGVMAAAPRVGAAGAGAVGEGVVGAGSAAEGIRQQTEDGLTTAKQNLLAAGSGVATSAFGAIGGLAARKLGIGDVDTMLAQGARTVAVGSAAQAPKGVLRRMAEGAVSEGVLEELPQSLSEQALQNIALNKPVTEGLTDAGVMGLLAGGAMGAGAGGLSRSGAPLDNEPIGAPAGPMTRAATLALPAPVITVGAGGTAMTADQRMAARQPADITDVAPKGTATDQNQTPAQTNAAPTATETIAPATSGAFATEDEARAYMSGQKRAGGASLQGLPLPRPDGTFGVALKGTPDYTIAEFHQNQQALRLAGVLDGDILTKSGAIFGAKQKGVAAMNAARAGPGYGVVPVTGGFVIRKGAPNGPIADIQPLPAGNDRSRLSEPAVGVATRVGTRAVAGPAVVAGSVRDQSAGGTVSRGADNALAVAPNALSPDAVYQRTLDKIQARYENEPNVGVRNAANAQAKATFKAAKEKQSKSVAQVERASAAINTVAKNNDQNQAPRAAAEPQAQADQAPEARTVEPAGQPSAGTPTGDASVQAAGVDIKAAAAKIIPDMTDAELTALQGYYAPDSKRAPKIAKELEKRGKLAPAQQESSKAAIDLEANKAATSTTNDLPQPTAAQKEAGNYAKGHVNVQGLDISIENPKGSTRSGIDPDGKPWSSTMSDHYGYLKRTTGADDEQVDVYVGPQPESAKVFIVDQLDQQTGKFDEHKVMLGYANQMQAAKAYRANFDKGWKVGPITAMDMDGFKTWLKNGDTAQPAEKQATAQTERAKAATEIVAVKSKLNLPNTVVMGVRDRDGEKLGDILEKHDGTKTGIHAAGLRAFKRMNSEFAGEGSGINSLIGATDAQGNPAWSVFPQAKPENQVLPIDSRMARGLWGDTDALMDEFVAQTAAAEDRTPKRLPNATAPEQVSDGVDDRELSQIVAEFNAAQASANADEEKITHVFDAPARQEIFRLADKVKVYQKDQGWMTVAQAKESIAEWKARARAQGENANSNGNAQRIVLSLFDLTGSWSKPWEEAGYQVYRFDIQDDPEMGDVNKFDTAFFNDNFGSFEGQDVYAILAACPCTDFAVSGARHFAAKDKDGRTVSSVKLVHQALATVEFFKPAVWAVENPVGRIEKLGGLPPWRLSFDPNHLGDPYTKKTLLWGRFNGDLPIAPVEPTEGSKMHKLYGGKSMKTKNARSETPEGFSYGFFLANNAADNMAMGIANKYDRLDRGLIEQAVAAGVTESQITEAVDDPYYMDLDDAAANQAIRDLMGDTPPAGKVKPAPKPDIVVDKAEMRPYRKSDGGVGYEAVPIVDKAPEAIKTIAGDYATLRQKLRDQQAAGRGIEPGLADQVARLNPAEDAKPNALNEQEKAAKAKMLGAAAKLAELLSKNTRLNITPEQEQKMLPIVIELFDGAMELGYVKFKQAARYVREFLANAIDQDAADSIPMDTLQGAYIATSRRHKDKDITPKGEVITVESFDELTEEVEQTPKKEDTGTSTNDSNATRRLDSTGTRPLEGAQAPDGRAPESGRDAGAGADRGRPGDIGGDAGLDAAGGDARGSLGADAGAVPVSGRGTRADPQNAKKPRVSRAQRVEPGLGLFGGTGTTGGLTPEAGPNPAPNAPPIASPQLAADDFTITDELALGEGGQKTKYRNNVAAIRLVNELAGGGRLATLDEQSILAKYVGWGGIPQAFDPANADWSKEYLELSDLMGPTAFAEARKSTRYAHYTSKQIIVDGIYAALRQFGFAGGKTLEAGAGVGNFIGMMPADMRSAGRFTAIEREPFSSRIAQLLYPQQNVQQADFTEFKGNDAYFDAAVGNPPFASDPQTDRSGRKHLSGLSLHNYFFAKSIDLLREGGIMAQVVTHSFMDAKGDRARKYMADRVQFLGAIRLPNSAFAKNANTEVTTDIVFLQKRPDSEVGGKAARADAKRWQDTGVYTDKQGRQVALNQYFIDNPSMMLGDFGAHGTMYGPEQPALVARPGQDTLALLKEAVGKLPAGVYRSIAETSTAAQVNAAVVALRNPSVREGGYFVEGDKLMQRLPDIAGEALGVEITPATQWTEKTTLGDNGFERIQALAGLRSTVRGLLAAEMADNAIGMKALRATLNRQYDGYRDTHGLLNDAATLRVFEDDPDFPLLASLEHGYLPGIGLAAAKRLGVKPSKSTAKKGPIFMQRVVAARTQVQKVDSPADALSVSMAERGKLDAAYIGQLLDQEPDAVLKALSTGDKPLLFRDPATDEYVLRDAYLSGNVRAKLVQAKAAGLFTNASELEAVQPADVGSHEISARIGSPWVPIRVYEAFGKALFGDDAQVRMSYIKANSSYQVSVSGASEVALRNTWGTAKYPADALLQALLNNRSIKVVEYVDKKPVTDVQGTEDANTKAAEIRERFGDWIFSDADRSELLTKAYNETNNNYVTRVYDAGGMTFPGKVPDSVIKFRRHQRNAIARIVQDRTALLDHWVGAGKTFTVVAAAMELKRTGLARKPMVAVPNHLVKQWAADFYRLYPGANVLTATKKDFEKANRRKFLARIATGDWDAVVIAHSSYGFIKPSPEFEAEFNGREIRKIMETIEAVEADDGDKPTKKRTIKQLEGMKERLENRIRSLRDKPMDDLLDFEQIGVDQLFVDEAHMFKNLMYSTKMQGVAGLNDPTGSQRAYDMYVKTNQVMEKNGRGQGVVFATGTPVSNSLAEMYHMMRYLMPAQMKELGFESFDAWANTYASVEQVWMQAPSGDGFKAQNRMSNFVNTPELLKLFDQVSDTVTMDDIKKAYSEENDGAEFPLPKLKGGRRTPVSLEKSAAQNAYMDDIAKRAKAIEQRKGPPKKGEDNILVVMSDARKAAMDIRLVDPDITVREPGGRIDRATDEAVARYQQYNAVKGTQLVFSDLGTPLKHAKKELKEYEALIARVERGDDDTATSATLGNEAAAVTMEDAEAAQAELDAMGPDWLSAVKAALRGFSVYDDFRAALIEKGIPEAEVAFIHDYNTDDQKAALFRKVNAGQIRVLLGSTAKLGAGTNVQERLVAEHHLDVPWRPSDVEQREGRIERQGNKLAGPSDEQIKGFEIEILAYVTRDTLDMRMWQVQETKLKMINQLRTRKIGREIDNAFEDMELSAGEMQAAATGDVNLLKEIQLRNDVKKLEQRRRSFDAQRNDLISRRRRNADDLKTLPDKLAASQTEAEFARAYQQDLADNPPPFAMNIDGKDYSDAREAQLVLRAKDEATEDVIDLAGVVSRKKAPLSIEINGELIKNRATMAELFSEARGDTDPIKWTFKKQDYRRRAKLATAIRQDVVNALADQQLLPVGRIGAYTVSVEGQPAKGKDGYSSMELMLIRGGKIVMSRDIESIGDTANLPARIIALAEHMLDSAVIEARYLERGLATAQKNADDLAKSPAGGDWPDQGKLDAARAAHKDVLALLKKKEEPATPANDEAPAASRTTSTGAKAQANEGVQKQVDAITAQWANAPKIVVAFDMQDARIPERIRAEDLKQRSGGARGTPEGFYFKGTAYLMSSQLKTPQDTARVLFHEVLGHAGLRGVFGDALNPILKEIAILRRPQVDAKIKEYGLRGVDDIDRLTAAEEVLAEMAQTTPEIGFVTRAIAAIRTWLRANVPGFEMLALTDAEIIRSYILPARGWVERGAKADRSGSAVPEFSRTKAIDDTLKAVTVTDLKANVGNRLADYRGLGLQFLGGRQLNDLYGKLLPQLPGYTTMVQQMSADANEVGANADQIATSWGKLPDERQLAELMHDATLAQIDPAKPFVPGDNRLTWGKLHAGFKALSPAAQQVFTDARNGYEEHYANIREAIRDKIERSDMAKPAKAALLERMDGEFFEKIKGVYFPLARFGKYVVVTRKGADVVSVSRAETLNEAETLRASMRKQFPADQGYAVGKVLKDKEFNAARDAVGRGFLKDLFGVLDQQGVGEELQDAVNQLYLASMPDLSWAKHGIHRKGTPGFSQDARRAYAQNMFHGARYLAKLRYADQLQDKLTDMQNHVERQAGNESYDSVKGQQLVDELNKRNDSLMNPSSNPLATALTSFGFVFHLGLSPASAMVNLSQTALVAYPIMGAKWGFDKSAAALLKASQETLTNKNDISAALNADERLAYDAAVAAGTIDVTNAHDLAGIAQGEDAKVSWKLRPVMKWASFLFHHAERFNRQVTFVASYRLARATGAGHEVAFEQATKATYDGHFDYAAANRPRVMQGNAAKVLLLFKQYAQNMIYTLVRQAQLSVNAETPDGRKEARKALGGLLVMHAAGAGVLGLPMVTTLLAAASMLGGSDDEPWDAETALRNMLADTFGQKPAEVMSRGLSRLTPFDISGRVGLDKLIFPDLQEGLEGQRLAESAMTAALGPVAGIGVNVLKGMQDMAGGEYARGLESMLPAALRGPVKALRYGQEGAKDKTGIVIQDEVSAAGVVGQALGFAPSDVRNATEGRGAIFQADKRLMGRRKDLMNEYAEAVMKKDADAVTEARADIAAFNEKNPTRQIRGLQLVQSVRNRQRRIDQAEDGVYLPKNRRDALAAGQFAAQE